MTTQLFTSLTDDDLVARVQQLAGCERRATAELIAALAELDARRLYLGALSVEKSSDLLVRAPVADSLPSASPGEPTRIDPHAPSYRSAVQPLAPEIFKVQFTLSRDGHDKLRRAQDLLRHVVPNGDIAVVFERALELLVEDLEKKKVAVTPRPRRERTEVRRSRHIPAAVKREVWKRDNGQCAFVGSHGRCAERGFLEFHHVIPYADGGDATVENIQLRCAAHNAYEAALWSGADVARERASRAWG